VFIIVGLSLFFTVVAVVDILLSCGLRLKCGYVVDRLDNVIGGVTFVSISVMWVASTLIAVSRQADRTVQAILLIEGVAVPAIGCIIVRWFGRRAVDYYYWRKCLRLLHRAADTQVPTDGINH
jgi:hypothetical protein